MTASARPRVRPDGRRDLTHVADVARAVALALRWRGPGAVVLNVGTRRNHSVLGMLAAATSWDIADRGSNSTLFIYNPQSTIRYPLSSHFLSWTLN
ncbi:MAG: hypothetical protein NTW21_38695 [Verrucomicrobia bacterium]|nr:hypothetical protein [Verrucomicrobiota bacterium]